MITRIEALNYRCFRYVGQDLGPFQILVGPNASGKSTFLDVLSLLKDLLAEGLERAIADRAPNYADLFWNKQGRRFELAIEAEIPPDRLQKLPPGSQSLCRYEVAIGCSESSDELAVLSEALRLRPPREDTPRRQRELFPSPQAPPESLLTSSRGKGWKTVVTKGPGGIDHFYAETGGWAPALKLGPRKLTLANLPEDETKFPVATWLKGLLLEGIQALSLSSEVMRRPCPPGVPRTFRSDGSNLPWVLHELQARNHSERLQQWIRHIRTAIPDLARIRTFEREEDRHRYLILEYTTGLEVPSWLVSDGTLRVLALTLLAYLPQGNSIYLIEEPENGIHPTAVQTVFESLTSVYEGQVLLATHSPVILAAAKPAQILCFAKSKDGAVDIVRGDEHPRLKHWRGDVSLGVLFASGVLG